MPLLLAWGLWVARLQHLNFIVCRRRKEWGWDCYYAIEVLDQRGPFSWGHFAMMAESHPFHIWPTGETDWLIKRKEIFQVLTKQTSSQFGLIGANKPRKESKLNGKRCLSSFSVFICFVGRSHVLLDYQGKNMNAGSLLEFGKIHYDTALSIALFLKSLPRNYFSRVDDC